MISKISIHLQSPYEEILQIQQKEFEKRIECRKSGISLPGDVVLFVEHFPVYTLGRHGNRAHLLMSEKDRAERGIEYVETNRGGDITYHGPGQLTVYPIIDLMRYRIGIKDYVWLLEECVIMTIKDYAIQGERIEGRTGVWIGKGTDSERKICAIGIRCSRHVTMHGFALNVAGSIPYFSGIVPCGLSQGVTSISLEAGSEVEIMEVENKVWKNLTYLLQLRIPSQESF